MFLYRAYGLTLGSNRTLPGLIAPAGAAPPGPPDVVLEFAEHLPASAIETDSPGWVQLPGPAGQDPHSFNWSTLPAAKGAYHRLRYGAVEQSLEYLINPGASQVWIAHRRDEWQAGAASLLLGQVMGCVLRLRGFTCLHASVVAIGQQAVAVLGAAGAGKSTFAAAAAQRGLAVLADDIAVLSEADGGFLVQPGYPTLRLGPAAIDAFYGAAHAENVEGLRRVFSYLEKRFVELSADDASGWRFQPEALPLAALYVLGPRRPELADVRLLGLTPAAALLALKAQSYVHFFLDQAMQAREFEQLGRVALSLPVRSIERPQGLGHLPALCQAIVEDVARLAAGQGRAGQPTLAKAA